MCVFGYEVFVQVYCVSDVVVVIVVRVFFGDFVSEELDVKVWIDCFVQWGDILVCGGSCQVFIEWVVWVFNFYGCYGVFYFLLVNLIMFVLVVDVSG